METYKITRNYFDSDRRDTIFTGLTLEEAQEHCYDKQTSSHTCTQAAGLARTEKHGAWFDGYEQE